MNHSDLAILYKPTFVFSKYEKYYPCSVEYLVSHAQLYQDEKLIMNYGDVTPEILSQNIGNTLKIHPDSYKGQIETAKVYYFSRTSTDLTDTHQTTTGKERGVVSNGKNYINKFIDIVFFLYFTYNGPFDVMGTHIGDHEADIEHVVLRFDAFTKKLLGMYFSSHNDEGQWVMKKDIKMIGNSPVVYVAKLSHAMYHTEGTQWRAMGFANDKTDFGFAWNESILQRVETDESLRVSWMNYTGLWSRTGVDSVVNREWWIKQRSKTSSWLSRMLPFECFQSRDREVYFNEYINEQETEKELKRVRDANEARETMIVVELERIREPRENHIESTTQKSSVDFGLNVVQINNFMNSNKQNDEKETKRSYEFDKSFSKHMSNGMNKRHVSFTEECTDTTKRIVTDRSVIDWYFPEYIGVPMEEIEENTILNCISSNF